MNKIYFNMRYLFTIVILIVLFGCRNHAKNNIDSVNILISAEIDTFKTKQMDLKKGNATVKYIYKNDTLLQKIEIQYLSKMEIHFILISSNLLKNISEKIEGKAVCDLDADPEIDEDEEENAYPATQYIYSDKCGLYIRIDLEQQDKVRIIEGDNCDSLHTLFCPFNSQGILKKD
ncbi:hypothetical protein FACS189429_1910 [Bacteroidia bacterium]|nr:hypothetical protein FACS189429_1910 [Bacteroidia bacterium]